MKRFPLFAACLLLSGLVSLSAQAQAPSGGGPAPQPSGGDPASQPSAVPLDSGTSLLLASGVAYGLRRLRRTQV